MSGGIAPSKSTIYVSNLPFSLTNNDLHKVFDKFGRVVKVTIMKDRVTRKNKGVAFILFLNRDDAHKCCRSLDNTQVFGRTIKCSIAKDNGRATDFIRRKEYKDKSRCYECGEEGHLTYSCPKNLLGNREPPEKKKRKRRYQEQYEEDYEESEESSSEKEEVEDPNLDSLAAAISYQQEKQEEEEYRYKVMTGEYGSSTSGSGAQPAKKYKKDDYFSDEEELD